jgi:hypothetical protein
LIFALGATGRAEVFGGVEMNHLVGRRSAIVGCAAAFGLAGGAVTLGQATQASAVTSSSGWTQQAQLAPGAVAGNGSFGTSVVLSGNTLIVGSPNATSSAYVYTLIGSTWTLQKDLTNGDNGGPAGFGDCVSLAGNVAVISSRHWSYVFDRSGSTWTKQAAMPVSCGQLSPSGNEFLGANDYIYSKNAESKWVAAQFLPVPAGTKLLGDLGKAISGNTVMVEGQNSSGAQTVYVFQYTGKTWTEQAALQPKVPAAGDDFGASIALNSDGDTAVIGAPLAVDGGSAYIFTRSGSTWTQRRVLANLWASSVGGNFGDAVAILGNDVAVGARAGNQGGPVVFYPNTGSGWKASLVMPRSGTTESSGYGVSVAIGTTSSGMTIAAGAPGNVAAGSAYVFTS